VTRLIKRFLRTTRYLAVAGAGAITLALLTGVSSCDPAPGESPSANAVVLNGSGYLNASAVLQTLEDDGWPVGDGYPSSPQFQTLRGQTRCSSSKTFVRTDADRGWGFICLGMPDDLYRKIHSTFANTLMILAPLYFDSGNGDLVVLGFGWPGDTSQKFANTLGVSGNYLLPPS
jgi:hypothetical protein